MGNLWSGVILIAAFILLFAAIFVITRKYEKASHYDEMQLKIRADGYKLGFYVSLAGLFIFGFMVELFDSFSKMVSPSFCMFAVGFAGIVTFAVYCIFKDAFYSIGQNRKGYIYVCAMVILLNGIGAIRHISEGTLLEDGTVTFTNCGNLLCMVSFIVILISLIVKEASGRKEAEE